MEKTLDAAPMDMYEWQCDYCDARFPEFAEALAHEAQHSPRTRAATHIQKWWHRHRCVPVEDFVLLARP